MIGSKTKLRCGKYKQRVRETNPYVRTLFAFNALSLVGGIVYGLYYGVFLYRSTFSLSVLAIDGLLGGFGAWAGYMLGVMVIRKLGYGRCLKLAFAGMALVAFATTLVAEQINEWFVVLAVLKAFPLGMYAATCDAIMLREVTHNSRGKFLQVKLALEFIVAIMLPTTVGALIHYTGGYQFAFVIAGLVYLTAVLIPVKLPKPELGFNVREALQTFRRPLYKRHAANRMVSAGFNQMNGFVIVLIPFLMLNSELKVGILTSIIALMASVVSLVMRKVKHEKKLKYGYAAYTARGFATMLFAFYWTAPVLMFWQMVNKLATPLHDPLQQSLDIHNDSLIMGQDLQKQALHINVLNNTLLLIGTTIAYGGFYLITSTGAAEQRIILQALIMSYALWRFVNLSFIVRINSKAQNLAVQN